MYQWFHRTYLAPLNLYIYPCFMAFQMNTKNWNEAIARSQYNPHINPHIESLQNDEKSTNTPERQDPGNTTYFSPISIRGGFPSVRSRAILATWIATSTNRNNVRNPPHILHRSGPMAPEYFTGNGNSARKHAPNACSKICLKPAISCGFQRPSSGRKFATIPEKPASARARPETVRK